MRGAFCQAAFVKLMLVMTTRSKSSQHTGMFPVQITKLTLVFLFKKVLYLQEVNREF